MLPLPSMSVQVLKPRLTRHTFTPTEWSALKVKAAQERVSVRVLVTRFLRAGLST